MNQEQKMQYNKKEVSKNISVMGYFGVLYFSGEAFVCWYNGGSLDKSIYLLVLSLIIALLFQANQMRT